MADAQTPDTTQADPKNITPRMGDFRPLYDYGLMEPELSDMEMPESDPAEETPEGAPEEAPEASAEAPYGALDLIETPPNQVGGP
jgi:hypothetical protein